jgi:hypothetical protein
MEETQWLTEAAGPFATMEEGKVAAKRREEGRWKWASSPGNGKDFSVFACNAHEQCTKLMRVLRVQALYYIQTKGVHGDERKEKKRKNSTLTFTEDAALRTAVNSGSRPAGLRVALTLEKTAELEAQGKDTLNHKLANGGLAGAL